MKRFFSILTLPILLTTQTIWAASYPVDSADITLNDSSRNRDVPVKIYYPQTSESQKFPILIFSHGAGGSKDGYAYLGRYWAEHGYVVLHPTHLGSDKLLLKIGRPLYNLRAVKQMTLKKDNLINRPKDVSFLLDSLPRLEESVPALKGHLDPAKVGVGGHSFGAYTSMAVAGAKVYGSSDESAEFEDKRVSAFLALSPQGPGGWAFKEDSWEPIRRPVFLMTGTQDKGLENGESYEWRLKAFNDLGPNDKYLAVISGVNHMDFADTQFDGKVRNPQVHEWIQQASLLFWDAYVKGDPVAKQTLKQGEFSQLSGVEVEIKSK